MNDRETFDHVKAHLLKQGRPSTGPNGCRYRGLAGGDSCSVGCLIRDDLYDPSMEGVGLAALLGTHYKDLHPHAERVLAAVRASGCEASLEFLVELQSVHDHVDPDGWEAALDRVEERYLGAPA